MALNFPSAPSTNATYTFNGKSWTYNGNAWALSTSTLSTSIVPESGNLYFTNARARTAISVTGSGSYDNSTGVITITGGGGSSTYGDSNVALLGYATNANVALKANVADLTTANVAELTNLYFTNARVYSNVVTLGYATNANVVLKSNIADLTTANVTELTNLYFTNARVDTALLSTGNIIPSGNNIQALGSPTNRFKDLYLSGGTVYLGDVVLQSAGSTLEVADAEGNVLFKAVDGSGFVTSTVFTFPGSEGNISYGDLVSSLDAFGVATVPIYDCMEPAGRSLITDLGTL